MHSTSTNVLRVNHMLKFLRNSNPSHYAFCLIATLLVHSVSLYNPSYAPIETQLAPLAKVLHLQLNWLFASSFFNTVLGVISVYFIAIYLNEIMNRFQLFRYRNFSVAYLFILLSGLFADIVHFSEVHIAIYFLLLSLHSLLKSIHGETKDGQMFDIITYISMASMFYLPCSFFLVYCLMGFVMFNVILQKHLLLILLAFVMPYLFFEAMCYLLDTPLFLFEHLQLQLAFYKAIFWHFDSMQWSNFILISLVFILGISYFYYHYYVCYLNVRKMLNLILLLGCNVLLNFVFVAGTNMQSLLFLLMPVSIFTANLIYIEYKKIWTTALAGLLVFWVAINMLN